MKFERVDISLKAQKQLNAGSLWIFSNEIKQRLRDFGGVALAEFYCQDRYLGWGYVNPHSLIAGRLISTESPQNIARQVLDRISSADEKRKTLQSRGSYRAVFSEADNLPGLIVDYYVRKDHSKVVVAQSNTAGMDLLRPVWQVALEKHFKPDHFVIRADSTIRNLENVEQFFDIIKGSENDLRSGEIVEDGLIFACDFVGGQKTGFFLDQKDNRLSLRNFANASTSVLDLCCYSGGWGMNALKAGARSVTFVDQSEKALELVKKSMDLNKFSPDRAAFIQEDVFDYVGHTKSRFDVIVNDPPAFIKSKKNVSQGTKAYKDLNIQGMSLLTKGGTYVACSCSFHMSDASFLEVLTESAQKSRHLAYVLKRGHQSLDHPWVLNRPETQYLKTYFLKLV